MAGRADVQAGKAYVTLYVRDTLTKGLQNVSRQLQAFGRQATALGQTLLRIGTISSVPFALSLKTFANFSDQMLAVQAVSQSTAAELASMTATAKQLGASTSFTAVQVGALMGELGRAGFAAAEINKMTGAVLDLSRATGTDSTLASGIMAATIRQFGMAAGDAGRVADALTVAANKSFNTVEQLGEALSYAGPVAADFNMSLEDTLAILGTLGNVGIQASNAGTALRRLLTFSGSGAADMQKIFGVNPVDAAGNMRPIVDILEEIGNATKNMGTADRATKFNEFFGLLGITGASAISKNIGSVKSLQAALINANGTAAATAKQMDSGLGGAFRILMSSIEGVAIAVGEALEGPVTAIAKTFQAWANWVQKVAEQNKGIVQVVAAVAAGVAVLGASLIALGGAASFVGFAITSVTAAFSALAFVAGVAGTVLAAIFSPAGLAVMAVVAGTAAVIAAFIKFTAAGQAMADFLTERFTTLRDFVGSVFGGIADAFMEGNLKLAAEIAWQAVIVVMEAAKLQIMRIWFPIRETLIRGWENIRMAATQAMVYVGTLIGKALDSIVPNWQKFFGVIGTGWEEFKNQAVEAIGIIQRSLDNLGGSLKIILKGLQAGVKPIAEGILPGLTGAGPGSKALLENFTGLDVDALLSGAGDAAAAVGEDPAVAAARAKRKADADAAIAAQEAALAAAKAELDRLVGEAAAARIKGPELGGGGSDGPPAPGGPAGLAGASAGASRQFETFFASAAIAQLGVSGGQSNTPAAILTRMHRRQEQVDARKLRIAEQQLKRMEDAVKSLTQLPPLLTVI